MNETAAPDRENRKHPRAMISLPVHLQINERGWGYPGVTVDVSKSGLQVQTLKEIPVSTRIKIETCFPKESKLFKFSEKAEVVWRAFSHWDDWEGYQYGIKFVQISKENDLKLSKMIGNSPCLSP